MGDRLHPDRYLPTWDTPCSEATRHGPPDGKGKCPWCNRKIATAMPAPDNFSPRISELTEAYERHYNPDFDSLTPTQIRQRYQMGQVT